MSNKTRKQIEAERIDYKLGLVADTCNGFLKGKMKLSTWILDAETTDEVIAQLRRSKETLEEVIRVAELSQAFKK